MCWMIEQMNEINLRNLLFLPNTLRFWPHDSANTPNIPSLWGACLRCSGGHVLRVSSLSSAGSTQLSSVRASFLGQPANCLSPPTLLWSNTALSGLLPYNFLSCCLSLTHHKFAISGPMNKEHTCNQSWGTDYNYLFCLCLQTLNTGLS